MGETNEDMRTRPDEMVEPVRGTNENVNKDESEKQSENVSILKNRNATHDIQKLKGMKTLFQSSSKRKD